MNCENCGAAMKLVDRRDYFVCEYCNSFWFSDKSPQAADGVKVLGAPSELSCPLCDMPLIAGSVEKHRVLHCEHCRGILATNDEFAEIVKKRRAKRPGAAHEQQALNPEELERDVRCPACSQPMDTHPYYGPGNAVVDSCPRCFLVWLDHGELGMIEKAPGRR